MVSSVPDRAPTTPRSPTAARTRNAILEAASRVLPRDAAASLGDIAEAAGVGRSTLHRHFADRAELIRSLALYVRDLSNAALEAAVPEAGDPRLALRRLVDGQLDLGAALAFLNDEPLVQNDDRMRHEYVLGEEVLAATLERVKDPADSSSIQWRLGVFWEVLRLGSHFVAKGTPRHVAVDYVVSTLQSGIATHR